MYICIYIFHVWFNRINFETGLMNNVFPISLQLFTTVIDNIWLLCQANIHEQPERPTKIFGSLLSVTIN